MAGTVTCAETSGGGFKKVVFDWLCSSSGAADSTSTYTYNGQLMSVVFDPDAGDTQPSDAYDVVLNDDDGYDLLNGLGANCSQSANVYKTNVDGLRCVVSSKLTLAVTNGGDLDGGVVTVVILNVDQPG